MQETKSNQFDNLTMAFNNYVIEKAEYYRNWQHQSPIISTAETSEKFREAGVILSKMIRGVSLMASERRVRQLLPLSNRALEVISIFQTRKPEYATGTYRTDFVFNRLMQPKFIEITCQFPLNGYFQSAVFNHFACEYVHQNNLKDAWVNEYEPFISFLNEKLKGFRSIVVIKGWDKKQTSRFFCPILRDAGFVVHEISYKEVWANRDKISKSFVISEIMISEIEELSNREIELLAESHIVNDYRTVFVAHDKRFFSILNSAELKKSILTERELQYLDAFLLKTIPFAHYTGSNEELIEGKDNWILKHVNLGRSREIFSGLEFSKMEWARLIHSKDRNDFVLQEFVPQMQFSGFVGDKLYSEFLTGTLLYFDERYFGQGLFRASSHFVANKVDNRNISPVVVKDTQNLLGLTPMASF